MQRDELVIDMVAGEDFALNGFWTDSDGRPFPVIHPAQADVVDGTGQVVLRFVSGVEDPSTEPAIALITEQGYFQLTAPRAVTRTIEPGRYRFDLFTTLRTDATVFTDQQQRVVTGTFLVEERVTVMENTDGYQGG